MTFELSSLAKIFFCTGARNHDLLKEFQDKDIAFDYDERMASFKALGLTKITQRPVAICTTSGTAVAECVSAMLEAHYSKLPLVLISGDRPKKLHGTGSPQTIHHEGLTTTCRGMYLEVTLDEFRHLKIENPQYPLHINVLIDNTKNHEETVTYHQDLSSFSRFLKDKKKPLFLFSHEEKSMRSFIEKFTQTGIPFYAETLSGGRHLSSIPSERRVIELLHRDEVDSVIRVGFTPLSKIWRLLELKPKPVFSFDSRNLPGLSFGDVLPFSSERLLKEEDFWNQVQKIKTWHESPSEDRLEILIQKYPHSEVAYFHKLQEFLSSENIIYLGNSLVIRFFELVQKKALEVHGNRGVNGIDGQLATAIGLALGTKKKVICILGDMTTLYDLSSLREMPDNLKLIIMNNKGGRIFEVLKLDQKIVMEHDFSFKKICQGLDLKYAQNDFSLLDQVQVLELNPKQAQTASFLEDWGQ